MPTKDDKKKEDVKKLRVTNDIFVAIFRIGHKNKMPVDKVMEIMGHMCEDIDDLEYYQIDED